MQLLGQQYIRDLIFPCVSFVPPLLTSVLWELHGAVISMKSYASYYFCRQSGTLKVIIYGTLLFYELTALCFVMFSALTNYLLAALPLDFGG